MLFTVAAKLFPESAVRLTALAAIGVLSVYFIASRRKILDESAERFFAALRIGVGAFVFLLVGRAALLSAAQYRVWQGNVFSRRLLPPEQPISYFTGYAWTHFGKEAAFTILFAGMLLLVMAAGNRVGRGRFFYREEPWLAGFGVLAAPWPAGILVMMAVLAAGVFAHAALAILGRKTRFPLVWFWLPATLIAIAFGDIIGEWIGLTELRI